MFQYLFRFPKEIYLEIQQWLKRSKVLEIWSKMFRLCCKIFKDYRIWYLRLLLFFLIDTWSQIKSWRYFLSNHLTSSDWNRHLYAWIKNVAKQIQILMSTSMIFNKIVC